MSSNIDMKDDLLSLLPKDSKTHLCSNVGVLGCDLFSIKGYNVAQQLQYFKVTTWCLQSQGGGEG